MAEQDIREINLSRVSKKLLVSLAFILCLINSVMLILMTANHELWINSFFFSSIITPIFMACIFGVYSFYNNSQMPFGGLIVLLTSSLPLLIKMIISFILQVMTIYGLANTPINSEIPEFLFDFIFLCISVNVVLFSCFVVQLVVLLIRWIRSKRKDWYQ